MKTIRYFALYKGDKFLTIGTKEELALFLNVKKETIDFYRSLTYQKRVKDYKNRFIIIIISKLWERMIKMLPNLRR